jgi:PiT family inorganic phosphate transporter
VSKTIGKGIVGEPLGELAVAAALLCAGLLVTLATFKRIPVSTSQAVVGAVSGIGLAGDMDVDWSKLGDIGGAWVICPIMTMALTWVLYRGTLMFLARTTHEPQVRRVLGWVVLASAAYSSYSLGANHLGIAIGPIAALDEHVADPAVLAVLGASSIAVGALFFSRGVIETVGQSIIPLDLPSAAAVQLSLGFGLHLFSVLGFPVSSSQAVVGALFGIGLVQGVRTLSMGKIIEVVVGWILTPTLAGGLAYVIYRVIGPA